ncbi:Rhodanese-like domain containing protein [Trichomonas vaginalis G3]|uniref:protein-tyrosine-phosphatase n=1 Tax=Trichomonas vaginalis (strain ATCC PRA-98 / G3) TaxID=412133 RepID=A2DQJ6_TRIV3|nr:positive regulation of cell cycle G2/M phase transition [Trichomonas vaginalis G3]EAY17280.1 Rhodanese-like domain containing protein [Trichomonas vaginalis G3]KAI5523272.1 positive regulation of cell cycle G2/M phase transition [Trichomonas vaginalis G3]|eukprot:XP_001329503.1 Rhodanese-like domain containing protein [Trichomonas vaginalis G3]
MRSPFKSPSKTGVPVPDLDFSPVKQKELIYQSGIPVLESSGPIPRITGHTLVDIITGVYDEYFEKLYIIDCRYPYEYEGGHINGAINCNDPQLLKKLFFETPIHNALIVFHCEFSHNRGPQMASIFRNIDRDSNEYPNLFYPDVYILDGGYRKFQGEWADYCDGGYTMMLDHRYKNDLMAATTSFRTAIDEFKNSQKKPFSNVENKSANVLFKSPMPAGFLQSPQTSKMLEYLASPILRKTAL